MTVLPYRGHVVSPMDQHVQLLNWYILYSIILPVFNFCYLGSLFTVMVAVILPAMSFLGWITPTRRFVCF